MTDRVNEGHGPDDRLKALLQAMWEKNRPVVLARIAAIETALSDLARSPRASQSSNARRSAEWEAHKLAGSLGTFGFHRGTEIAREIELTLASAGDLDSSEVRCISDLTLQLRDEVEKGKRAPMLGSPTQPVPGRWSAPSPPSSETTGTDSIKEIQGVNDEPLTETKITMKSSPGKETTFTVTLPVDVDSRGGEKS